MKTQVGEVLRSLIWRREFGELPFVRALLLFPNITQAWRKAVEMPWHIWLYVAGSTVSFWVPAYWYWSTSLLVLEFQLVGTGVSVSWYWPCSSAGLQEEQYWMSPGILPRDGDNMHARPLRSANDSVMRASWGLSNSC